MPEDEETPGAPGWFADGILENGQDPGAVRRAAIREQNARRQQAEADRVAQRGQDRAERPQRVTVPGKPLRRSGAAASPRWAVCIPTAWPGSHEALS